MSVIPTKDCHGHCNGWVIPVWHADDGPRIEQVYVTAIAKGASKGPHLHKVRNGLFACVSGAVEIVKRYPDGVYEWIAVHPGDDPVPVPAGIVAELRNVGEGEAILLNMPTPPWRASEPDEWPVENWSPPCF